MKVAFGVCSLGLGHATRSAPLIRKLVKEGHEVVIISHGRALSLIRREFPSLRFYDIEDYPIRYTEKAHQLVPMLLKDFRKILRNMVYMHRKFLDIDAKENFDIIISDSRYDVFNRFKPSYLIIHQLRIMLRAAVLRGGTMFYNSYMTKFFTKIIVPDLPNGELSGEMAKNLKFIPSEKIEYIGPLSSFRNLHLERDIDVLISISGPEPQRTLFEKKAIAQVDNLDGKIVITLGRPEGDAHVESSAELYYYLSSEEREKIMNRSKIIISRSGYSTIMDMYVIGGKAGFVPTPGQPEQRYLAKYLHAKGLSAYMPQEALDIPQLVESAKELRGFKGGYQPEKSVEAFMEVIG